MYHVITIHIAALSIVGVIANIHKKRWCFLVWFVTNLFWFLHDFYFQEYAQAGIFLIYLILSIYGWAKWRQSK